MTKQLKTIALAVLMAGGMAVNAMAFGVSLPVPTPTPPPLPTSTNLWSLVTMNLTTFSQGRAVAVRGETFNSVSVASLGTKDIIRALSAATATNFSAKAALYIVSAVTNGVRGDSTFVIKDGTTNTDVTSYFSSDMLNDTEVITDTVKGGVILSGTSYRANTLDLTDNSGNSPALSFKLQGFVVSSYSPKVLKDGEPISLRSSVWTVNGVGNHNGSPFVAKGVVTIGYPTIVLE